MSIRARFLTHLTRTRHTAAGIVAAEGGGFHPTLGGGFRRTLDAKDRAL